MDEQQASRPPLLDREATSNALVLVVAERAKQDAKWGRTRHLWADWHSILSKQVGDAARAGNEIRWGSHRHDPGVTITDLRDELVQVAAVAVATIEHLGEVLQHIRQRPDRLAEIQREILSTSAANVEDVLHGMADPQEP